VVLRRQGSDVEKLEIPIERSGQAAIRRLSADSLDYFEREFARLIEVKLRG
jgi:hypothetical protein